MKIYQVLVGDGENRYGTFEFDDIQKASNYQMKMHRKGYKAIIIECLINHQTREINKKVIA